MIDRFSLDGFEYNTNDLSHSGMECVEKLVFVRQSIHDLRNRLALLAKAKNGYIEDMKTEIIQERTGVDFGDLFSDD